MSRVFIFTMAVCAWLLCEAAVVGQGGGMGGMGGSRHGGNGDSSDPDRHDASSNVKVPPPPQPSPPHWGEYVETETNHYEIVYLPLQARVYLFDHDLKPLTARDVHARMSLKNVSQPIPFQYVALPAGTTEQDYVVAAFDFRQLPGTPTPITFDFSGLPDRHKFLGIWDRHEGAASFSLMFSAPKIRPYVARVPATDADREGIARQMFCPVSRQMLGTNGPIVKLYIADYPLYLAGEECIAAVKAAPETYLHPPAVPLAVR